MTSWHARGFFAAVLGLLLTSFVGFARASDARPSDPTRISQTDLDRLVRRCAPQVSAVTQAAIVAVESGGDAWALHDDNDGHVYLPSTHAAAVALALALVRRNREAYGANDRGVDVGLAQINSGNYAALGVTPDRMLEPCENLRASAKIIVAAYVRERALLSADPSWRGDQVALRRALQVYNSGSSHGDDAYVRAIFAAVGLSAPAPRTIAPSPNATTVGVRVVRSALRGGRRAVAVGSAPEAFTSAQFVHVDVATPDSDSDRPRESGAQFAHEAAGVTDPTEAPR